MKTLHYDQSNWLEWNLMWTVDRHFVASILINFHNHPNWVPVYREEL